MPSDSDVALLGTGIAPLLAASTFLAEGKSVLILNPEWDFFSENSELSLDPLWPAATQGISLDQVRQSLPENVLANLRPHFPGAIELWPAQGYQDRFAPHVRSRQRLWVQSLDHRQRTQRVQDWQEIEDLYLRSADAGFNPQSLDGAVAYHRFPGSSNTQGTRGSHSNPAPEPSLQTKGISLPKLCDVDVPRYRNGLREFIRDRMDSERVVTNASQIELTADGVRYRSGGTSHTSLLREGLMVFWTPRLTKWVLAQSRKYEVVPKLPRGVRTWEDWSLVSREAIDPTIVGSFENMVAWAETEGAPSSDAPIKSLAVLRAGALASLKSAEQVSAEASTWASGDSFRGLSRLCHDFLGWENYTVRSVRPRSIFEWDQTPKVESFSLLQGSYSARVVCAGDGPIFHVARAVREACQQFESLRIPQ
ncbi:MAG: hypothetical protein H7222_07530 [Methylotenera sp.]|nr:hypothetical protein [Oligoflexia bacterium]